MRRSNALACTVLLLSSASIASAQTAIQKAVLARTMWSAFQCGAYAEMSGNVNEHERLFNLGLSAGREFLDALQKGQIPTEVLDANVPVGVSLLLQGPSIDFIIGNIFAHAIRDAFDDIVKRENGMLLDPSKWIQSDEARKNKAEAKYGSSNCILLK
ncbi:hypothetical protein Q2941_39045 [Bradyrhizobium sp. UFLA05-153]